MKRRQGNHGTALRQSYVLEELMLFHYRWFMQVPGEEIALISEKDKMILGILSSV